MVSKKDRKLPVTEMRLKIPKKKVALNINPQRKKERTLISFFFVSQNLFTLNTMAGTSAPSDNHTSSWARARRSHVGVASVVALTLFT